MVLRNKKWLQIAILSAALIIAVVTIITGMSRSSGSYPKEGAKAPDFQLADQDGNVHRLSDYKGKTVILNFWATSCPPCRNEMPALQRQSEEWSDKNVVVLGVNMQFDNDVAVTSFLGEYGITFQILHDRTDEVRKRYGVNNFPSTFFIDPKGVVRVVRPGEMEEDFIRNTLATMQKSYGG